MKGFLFSICIPVYNAEKYLPRALDSIVYQSFDISKIEVVIVNDASPNTLECTKIVDKYSNSLSIQYIKKEKNEGLFLARKTAVENAHGQYILFLDSDDTIALYTFEILSKFIIDQPDYVQFRMYNVIGTKKTLLSLSIEDEKNKTLEDVLQNKAIHNLVNKCYNGHFLKKIYAVLPNFYAVYAEDYYQSVIIEYYTNQKIFIDIPLYNYFRYIGITSDDTFKNKEKILRIFESFQNIKKHLVAFFEEHGYPQYGKYVEEYIKRFYFELVYCTNSLKILIFILRILPSEYHSLKLKMFETFLIHNLKQIIKFFLPYGVVQLIYRLKHRKEHI